MIYIDIVSLKIATGKLKGSTLLSTDKARELRPTQAKVREALVNIIRSAFGEENFTELRALDLFAGIGSLGFEFLSNGFKEVVFCDYDILCINLIKKNSHKLKLADKSKVLKAKLPLGLKDVKKAFKGKELAFDVIFLDPPYKYEVSAFIEIISTLIEENFMSPEAILVIETDQASLLNSILEAFPGLLTLLKEKNYGDTFLFIFKK